MSAPLPIPMDIDRHAALTFPRSLPEFQRLFPDDAACAEYLEKLRWGDGFVCPHCGVTGEPFRIADPSGRADIPQVPTSDRADCRPGHGAQSHAVVHLKPVLPGAAPRETGRLGKYHGVETVKGTERRSHLHQHVRGRGGNSGHCTVIQWSRRTNRYGPSSHNLLVLWHGDTWRRLFRRLRLGW